MAQSSCAICKGPATKKVIWADGRAYQPSCDKHIKDVQSMLTEKNGEMTELTGVKDLAVPSAAYPTLERKPGGPDNWVERAGGLPSYIERIAKHLHYERGFSISHAIATGVNTVKRWAKGSFVTKTGTLQRVSPATQAKAIKSVAEWNAKKGSAGLTLSAILAPEEVLMSSLVDLAQRANQISDPVARGEARQKVLDLAANGFPGLPPLDPTEIGDEKGDERDPDDNDDPAEALVSWIEGLDIPDEERTKGLDLAKAATKGSEPDDKDADPVGAELSNAVEAAGEDWSARRDVLDQARAADRLDLIPEQWAIDLAEVAAEHVLDLANSASARRAPARRRRKGFVPPQNPSGMTADKRPSYKRQGRWGHGFKPLDAAARASKAKGSPVALQRVSRLFGGGKSAVLKAKDGGSERVKRAALAIRPKTADATETQRLKIQNTANRPAVSRRSDRAWEDIPEEERTIRNGKRYVMTTFNGKNQLTEWVGPKGPKVHTDPTNRRFASVTSTQLEAYTAGQLRKLLEVPGQPAAVKTKIYAMIEKKQQEARNRG